MSKRSRVVLGTEEDLERIFGSNRLAIGFPVRPPAEREHPQDEAPAAEEAD